MNSVFKMKNFVLKMMNLTGGRGPAKFIIFNPKFLVFNSQFLVFNAKFIIFTHEGELPRCAVGSFIVD